MDKDKLAKLRLKATEAKAKKHKDIIDGQASIKDALLTLSKSVNESNHFDPELFSEQMDSLRESITFGKEVKSLDESLKSIGASMLKPEDIQAIVDAVKPVDNSAVTEAVNQLMLKIDAQTVSQSAGDYQPVRRVIKLAGKLVFDDTPTPERSLGGGGSRGGIQSSLIENGRVKTVVEGIDIGDITVEPGNVQFDDTEVTDDNPLPVYISEANIAAIAALIPTYIDNETPSGVVNGSNKNFSTFYDYKPGTTKLYLNGLRQREGVGFNYFEAGGNDFTFDTAPALSYILIIDYMKA